MSIEKEDGADEPPSAVTSRVHTELMIRAKILGWSQEYLEKLIVEWKNSPQQQGAKRSLAGTEEDTGFAAEEPMQNHSELEAMARQSDSRIVQDGSSEYVHDANQSPAFECYQGSNGANSLAEENGYITAASEDDNEPQPWQAAAEREAAREEEMPSLAEENFYSSMDEVSMAVGLGNYIDTGSFIRYNR